MVYIKKVHIEGYKKFNSVDIEFNEKKNLLVGDNGSGKSTVLEAIDLALNHSIKNFDFSLLQLLFNKDDVKKFKETKDVSSLPKILIQVFFGGVNDEPDFALFYGCNYKNSNNVEEYGVEFKAELDTSLQINLTEQISKGYIPFEYYQISTVTFANSSYRPGISNISFILINAANTISPTYNSYSKLMFKSISLDKQLELKNKFSIEFDEAMKTTMGLLEDDSPVFSYNVLKTSLENIVEIYEGDLPLSSLGKGNESIIKIKNLLKKHYKATIIGIEEPENHLSYSSMNKMIEIIQNDNIDKQLIITSHSNLIASGIGLNHIIGLSNYSNNTISLKEIKKETYEYFEALPSDNMLQFILSKKVILVEGPSELIYMDYFYKKMFKRSLISDGITCISVNGLSFKHYISIAKIMRIKVCVITDNDNDICKVDKLKGELASIYPGNNFDLFTDRDPKRRTFEICLYEDNKYLVSNHLILQKNAEYKHEYTTDKYIGKMLNDKTGTALNLVKNPAFIENVNVPSYIQDALKFINKEDD